MKITSNKPEPVKPPEEIITLILAESTDYETALDEEGLDIDNELEMRLTKTQAEALYKALGEQLGKSEDSQSNWEKILKDIERLNPKNDRPYDTHKWPWVEPSIQPPDFRKWGEPIITYLTKDYDKPTSDLIKTVSNLFEDLTTTSNNKTTQNNTKTQ